MTRDEMVWHSWLNRHKRLKDVRREEVLRRAAEDLMEGHYAVGVIEMVLAKIDEKLIADAPD